ncbi:MAG: O-antigen ligase family protein [Campylobacterales bacterium]|nr:O-antigen ligase family protein [Campylobacterales bacterium]
MFVWPIPRTIAVRNISIALSVLIFGYLAFKNGVFRFAFSDAQKKVFVVLTASTLWFYLEAIVVSPETAWALKELMQWISAIVCFGLGFLVANIEDKKAKIVFLIVLSAIFAHIFYIDLFAVKYFVSNQGTLPTRIDGLTEGPDKANYITNWALALIGAEIYFRTVKHKRLIPIDNFLLGFLFVLVIASSYFETMRFGFIGLIFTFIGFLFLYLLSARSISASKKSIIFFLSGIIFISFLYVSYKSDPRWNTLKETLPIALDTEHNKGWLSSKKYGYPKLSNGEMVSTSNYERPAWAKEGLILIAENPLGVGYGRNAFGHALKAKYGEGGGHSHSGIIDLGIGTGVPGIILWVVFLGSLVYYGFSSFKKHGSYFGMALFFIASGFFFRMIVDSVIRDHMLEQFMFLAGFLLTMSAREIDAKNSASEV